MARLPSILMLAPMRTISLACMKRFSKMVSVTIDVSFSLGHQRHVLGLHVGGKAGMFNRGDIPWP